MYREWTSPEKRNEASLDKRFVYYGYEDALEKRDEPALDKRFVYRDYEDALEKRFSRETPAKRSGMYNVIVFRFNCWTGEDLLTRRLFKLDTEESLSQGNLVLYVVLPPQNELNEC